MTPDLFDGVFDNHTTGRRGIWKDGRLCRYARRNAVGTNESMWRELHAPWETFPDLPVNASTSPA